MPEQVSVNMTGTPTGVADIMARIAKAGRLNSDDARYFEDIAALNAGTVRKTADDCEPGLAGFAVLKSEPDKRITFGVAYAALKPDVSKAADGFRDFASAQVIEAAAYDFLASGREIGLFHEDGTEGHGEVVESYIHKGQPMTLTAANGTSQTVQPGDWCLSVRWDENTWPLVKSGRLNGYSPQGSGKRATPSADRLAELRS